MTYDFGGYATRNDIRCTDGRVIKQDAFKHQDKTRVPLVWQHSAKYDPTNVLGYVDLENRADGVYGWASFNNTDKGRTTKLAVEHGDLNMLSIHANRLEEANADVRKGNITEVSLVLAGANPGAVIDNVQLAHAGEWDNLDDDEIVYLMPIELAHEDKPDEDTETVEDVFETLSDKQKNVVYAMISEIISQNDTDKPDAVGHSDAANNDSITHNDQEGSTVQRNIFQGDSSDTQTPTASLTHDQLTAIVDSAKKTGSFKQAFLEHATTYGIENIELLFPDAKSVTSEPEFVKRRTGWVDGVLSDTRKSPFSRIKSLFADITADEARAKGYIKTNLKKEEFFALAKRVTGPQTVYKKQKLDRDDIIDITDLDVVVWLKREMRLMLDEELAGAILFGDGRELSDPDKIKSPAPGSDGVGIRAIAKEDPFYAPVITVAATENFVDEITLAMAEYEGSGMPKLYMSSQAVALELVKRDADGRRIYRNRGELASDLGVSEIVDVPAEVVARGGEDLLGVIVNLRDFTLGADKGGEVNFFDDFDIDVNQYKYLYETRLSGALTKHASAIVVKRASAIVVKSAPRG